jgi:PT repeat
MNVGGDGFDLEQLLEQELKRAAGQLQGPSAGAAQSAYHAALVSGGIYLSPFSSITAFVSSKVAVAATAVVLVGGGAAVTATAATGSTNPTVWGNTFVQAVQGCKTTIGTGPTAANHTASGPRDNIGQCVSAIAKANGAAERALHSQASNAPTNHPTGKPSDLPSGKPSDVPVGKPSNVPQGQPSNVPVGPPSDRPTPHPTGKP